MKIRNRIFGKTVILAALCGVNALSFGQNAETKMAVQDTTKVKADKSEKTSSYCPNEISFWAAGGWSDLFYRPNFGHRENKLGGAFGLGYSHYFTENWGFLIGAEMAVYRSGYTANYLHDNYDTPDLDPYEAWDINFSYRVDNYKEKQTLWNLNIPLQLLWQSNLRGNHRYYASAGFKLGIPISSRYESENATITGTGYVYHLEQWLNNETSTLGYGKFENQGDKGKLNLGLSYIGTLEGGIKWNIGAGNLYTGLYFDYGFNDVVKGKHDDRFVEYNSYERGDYKQINSVLTSQYTDNGELYRLGGKTDRIVEKVAPIAFGVKVRFSLGLGCDNDKKDKDAKSAKDAKDKNGDDIDPYRQGYRDAYNDLGDKANNRQPASAQTDNEPVRKNAKPIDYTPAPERNNYYSGDPLLEAEMKRATAEYGKLTDLLVLYVDGYEINQSKLSPIMEKMIDDKIRLLQKYNNDKYIIICEGHTCDLGREEFNLNLGQMRAEVVREYLITKGFMGDNLIATSKGESTPIVVNDSEANRKINRRVVFLIKEKR